MYRYAGQSFPNACLMVIFRGVSRGLTILFVRFKSHDRSFRRLVSRFSIIDRKQILDLFGSSKNTTDDR